MPPQTAGLEFVEMDIDDPASIARALEGRSLCIHTAGPFQQRETPTLLSACIDEGIPYCDGVLFALLVSVWRVLVFCAWLGSQKPMKRASHERTDPFRTQCATKLCWHATRRHLPSARRPLECRWSFRAGFGPESAR